MHSQYDVPPSLVLHVILCDDALLRMVEVYPPFDVGVSVPDIGFRSRFRICGVRVWDQRERRAAIYDSGLNLVTHKELDED